MLVKYLTVFKLAQRQAHIMDTKVQELVTPLTFRLTQLHEYQNTLPVLLALGVVLLSYLIYNVR